VHIREGAANHSETHNLVHNLWVWRYNPNSYKLQVYHYFKTPQQKSEKL